MPDTITELGFRNPGHPGVHIETLTLAELRRRLTPTQRVGHHRLGFHQLLLVESGTGTFTIDFVRHTCRPGSLFWMHPEQVQHGIDAPGVDGRLVLFTAAFLPAVPPLAALMDNRFDTVRWDLQAPDLGHIADGMRQLNHDYASACATTAATTVDIEPVEIELLRHELVVLLLRLARLARCDDGRADPGSNAVYRQFRQELERRYTERRGVEDYAMMINYSAKTLNRACRAATGRTAKQVIDRRVILEAKRLLVHTEQSIATIGRKLGFAEATNFGKYFAQHTGMTPGAFRSNNTG